MKFFKTVICILSIIIVSQKSYSQNRLTDSTITDFDGNVYPIVQIGNQIWMAENLRTTHFNDGTVIPQITNNIEWSNLSTPGYCFYDNDTVYFDTYGALYNWHTVEIINLCPMGWHVPTNAEWTTLTDYLVSIGHSPNGGSALKSETGWYSEGNGTNDYGFTALPGGGRNSDGTFSNIGRFGNWWCSTESSTATESAYIRMMFWINDDVHTENGLKKFGYAVRCIKNNEDTGTDDKPAVKNVDKFVLHQNYPNPFNPLTTIKYKLQKSSNVILKVYNLSGQELETLVNEFQIAGEHNITWQPNGLSSGVYIYRLQAGGFTDVRKMIFME